MFEMLLAIATLIAVAFGMIWISEQISAYMHNENLQDVDNFDIEPLFKA